MNKRVILLFLLLLIPIVGAHKVEMVSNTDQCLISCETIYKISAEKTDIVLDDNTYWFEFRNKQNLDLRRADEVSSLKNFDIQYFDQHYEDVLDTRYNTVCDTLINKSTGESYQDNCVNEPYQFYNKVGVNRWINAYNQIIPAGESRLIKVVGNKKFDGEIDNVLFLKDDENPKANFDGYVSYSEFAWWNSQWNKCRVINVTNPVNENLTNYTVLVKFNATNLTGLSKQYGDDIRFVIGNTANCSDTNNAELPIDIEYYNNTDNSSAWMWTRMNLTNLTTHFVLMYYNNSAATLPAKTAANGQFAVYDDNFVGVWHLRNAGVDSTINGVNCTMTGTANRTAGQISNAYEWQATGVGDRCDFGDADKLEIGGQNVTIELWQKRDTSGAIQGIFTKWNGSATQRSYSWYWSNAAAGNEEFDDSSNGAVNEILINVPNSTVLNASWFHLALIWQPSSVTNGVKFYTNGSLIVANTSAYTSLFNGTANGYIGQRADGVNTAFDGHIDEVRWQKINRSTNWILANYRLQNNSAYFENFSAEVDGNLSGQINNETWVSPAFETASSLFQLNITNTSVIQVINLTYNNSVWNMTSMDNKSYGNTTLFNITLRVPLVPLNQTNVLFQWNYTIANTPYSTTAKNQLVFWNFYPYDLNFSVNITETSTGLFVNNVSNYGGNLTGVAINSTLQYNQTNFTQLQNASTTAQSIEWDLNITPSQLGAPDSFSNYTVNLTGFFNMTFNGSTYVRNGSFENQTIYKIILGNCSTNDIARTLGIQFFIRDVDTNNIVTTANMNPTSFFAYFNYSNGGRSYTNMTWMLNGTPQLCMYPRYENDERLDRNITITASGYNSNSNNLNNYSLFNTQTNVTIFLQNSSGVNSQNITFNVLDELENPVINVSVSVELYNTSCACYTLLTTALTDWQGQHQFSLDISRQYRINLTNQSTGVLFNLTNGLRASVGPFQILDTSLTFRILLGTVGGLGPLSTLQLFYYNLTYGSPINFTWNDINNVSSGVVMTVDSINGTNVTQVYYNTSSLDNGTMIFDITIQPAGLYVAKTYMVSTLDGNTYLLKVITADTRTHSPFGTDGIWFVFLAYVSMTLLLSWHPSISILMGMAMLIVSLWFELWIVSASILGGIVILGIILVIRMAKE